MYKLENKKHQAQRERRGYSSYDLMDMDVYLTTLIKDMLFDFEKKTYGIPVFVIIEYLDKHNIDLHYNDEKVDELRPDIEKYWHSILKSMIYHFKEGDEDSTSYANKYEKAYLKNRSNDELREKWFTEERKKEKYCAKHLKQAFVMLSKYMDGLWF